MNNAALFATLHETPFVDIDVALWDQVMAVNVRGPFLMAKHVVPHMIAQGYGKIINIGSGSVFRGMPNMLHYVTSKGAMTAFTRALSRELGEHGICVNTLAPGFTLSDTLVASNPGHVSAARQSSIQRRALKRDEHPQDLLGTLVFLAASDSDFMTGQTLAVDGGAVNTEGRRFSGAGRRDSLYMAAARRIRPKRRTPMAVTTATKTESRPDSRHNVRARGRPITTRFPSTTWPRCGRC